MRSHEFIAQAQVICDRCGEAVKVGEMAVAEFYSDSGKCRICHKKCPAHDCNGRKPRSPFRPVRVKAATHKKIHN